MTKLTKSDYNRIVARISALHLRPGEVHNGRHWLIYMQNGSYYIFDKTKKDYIMAKKKIGGTTRGYNTLYKNWEWSK